MYRTQNCFLLHLPCHDPLHKRHHRASQGCGAQSRQPRLPGGRPAALQNTCSLQNRLYLQVNCLLEAWEWRASDSLLHVLPLHHTHGIVNCLLCPLTVGATVRMLPSFSAASVWDILTRVSRSKSYVSLQQSLTGRREPLHGGADHLLQVAGAPQDRGA